MTVGPYLAQTIPSHPNTSSSWVTPIRMIHCLSVLDPVCLAALNCPTVVSTIYFDHSITKNANIYKVFPIAQALC